MRHSMFLYFDLGNVLLYFDHEVGCRQVAQVTGLPAEQIRRLMLEGDFLRRVETGAFSRRQAYDAFCRATHTRPDRERLELAASDIFRLNHSMLPVVAMLKDAGYRVGLLSNTSQSHWRFVCAKFKAIFPHLFDVLALSFEIGAAKPDERIFLRAAELAGEKPSDIVYYDDIPANVEAARRIGFNAVAYTDTPALVAELRARGVRFNY